MLDKLWSIGNATSPASESEFGLIVLSELIAVEEITFSESVRLKAEDLNPDLGMKWSQWERERIQFSPMREVIARFLLEENKNDDARMRKVQSHS